MGGNHLTKTEKKMNKGFINPPPPRESQLSKIILTTVLAFSLILTLSFAACGNGSTGSKPPVITEDPALFESMDAEDNYYKLVITKAGRAVLTPGVGDSYVLTIIFANGTTNVSKGKVAGKNGGELQLQPEYSGAETFKIKTESGLMTGIIGTTIAIEGGAIPVPPAVDPVKSYDSGWKLYANKWVDSQTQQPDSEWRSDMNISEFTLRRPKERLEEFYFYVDGISDKPMQEFRIDFESHDGSWQDYQWLGSSDGISVQAGKPIDYTFKITIWQEEPIKTNPNRTFLVKIFNAEKLSDSIEKDTVMATISNFRIRLVGTEESGE
jgi:hypothetical protein